MLAEVVPMRRSASGLALILLATLGIWHEAHARGARSATARSPQRGAEPAPTSPSRSGAQLRFEPNQGQFDEPTRYLARGQRYGLQLTREGATLALRSAAGAPPALLSIRLVGGRAVEPRGEVELAGRSNYFVGSDRGRWRREVPAYERVRYAGVLPGVDVVYYGTQGRELEYDVELAAGVDPRVVQIELDGLASLALAPNGDALLGLADGSSLRQLAPVAYQLDASGARRFVPARFHRLSGRHLGFELGGYDRARPLIIDPVLSYGSYLGGSRYDEFLALATDASGSSIAVGYTTGTLFPTHAPQQPGYGGGAYDAVVVKLNAAGNGLVYSTYLGGSDTDQAYGVGVDGSGNALVTGITYSPNFPTASALQPAHGGGLQDAFVTKLSASGALLYSTYLGGSQDDYASGIAVHPSGEAYVVGTTASPNFPRVGGVQAAHGGSNDAFVSRLSISGGALLYSTFLGGHQNDYGQAISVDIMGSAVVVGKAGSAAFPTLAAAQPGYGGGVDAFVSRLDAAGSAFVYSTFLGGSLEDGALGVTQNGSATIVVGSTKSSNFPTLKPAQIAAGGGTTDAFVARYSSAGALAFSTYLGGSGSESATAAVVDQTGFVHVAGTTSSPDLSLESPILGQESLKGTTDALLAGYHGNGARLYASYLGGNSADTGVALAVGPPTTIQLLGNTFSSNFPTAAGLFGAPLGPQDGYLVKLATPSIPAVPSSQPFTLLLLVSLLLGGAWLLLSGRQREA